MRHECPRVDGYLPRLPDACPWPTDPGVVAGRIMAGARSLGPLLVLLWAVVSVSLPVTVVRLNKAMLDYGKRPANLPPSV